jgi:hypothetical protein
VKPFTVIEILGDGPERQSNFLHNLLQPKDAGR